MRYDAQKELLKMSSIKAKFGADVSEVEAKMLQATRATKAYERAVQGIAKSQPQGGGMFDKVTSSGPKAIETVKQLAGAFGSAGAAAGLVPGLGVAAIGVAALSAAVGYIAEEYGEAAESAKKLDGYFKEIAQKTAARNAANEDAAMTDAERAEYAKAQLAIKKKEWMDAAISGQDEMEVLQKRNAFDEQREKTEKAIAAVKKGTDAEAAKASEEEKKREEERVSTWFKNQARTDKQKQDSAEADAKAKKEQQAEFEKMQNAHQEWMAKQEKDEAALAEARYKHIWDNATLEQKIAETKKKGQEAYAKAQKSQSAEDIKALGDLRVKYAELNAEKAGGGGGKPMDLAGEGTGRTRNDKGQLMRNGVVISEEDALRTEKTKAETLGNEGKTGESESLLKEIRDYLKPTGK
jgi:hypothetical protein